MPGYEVIGISQASSTPWESTDALHCRTHEIPDNNMLHIVHTPWHSIISAGTDIVFNVEITAHSGQPLYTDSLFVCYKVNSGDWQRSYLQPLTRNNYTTSLSGFSYGDSIRYFIHAADQSGRNADHPVFASLDPHLFVIQPDTTPLIWFITLLPQSATKQSQLVSFFLLTTKVVSIKFYSVITLIIQQFRLSRWTQF